MPQEIKFSEHAKDRLIERNISEEWVWRVINSPDSVNTGIDNNIHYTKAIPKLGGRILRVIVNPNVVPNRVVTVFFDRRLQRQK